MTCIFCTCVGRGGGGGKINCYTGVFHLSAEVAHIGVPPIYQNTVSSETTQLINFKFHMEPPYDRLAKL